jgi:hypothetical protein
MEGSWAGPRAGTAWPRPGHTARIVLETDDVVAVGFQLGIVEIVARDREPEIVGHLGPDLLGPDLGTPTRPSAASTSMPRPAPPRRPPDRRPTEPSAGHSWTSGASQVSARSTCARSSSWRAVSPLTRVRVVPGPGPGGAACSPAADVQRTWAACGAGHHRQPQARRGALRLPPHRPALPPLRHPRSSPPWSDHPRTSGGPTGARTASPSAPTRSGDVRSGRAAARRLTFGSSGGSVPAAEWSGR